MSKLKKRSLYVVAWIIDCAFWGIAFELMALWWSDHSSSTDWKENIAVGVVVGTAYIVQYWWNHWRGDKSLSAKKIVGSEILAVIIRSVFFAFAFLVIYLIKTNFPYLK